MLSRARMKTEVKRNQETFTDKDLVKLTGMVGVAV